MVCLILNLGCECQTIVISFKNDALLRQSDKQGIYQRAGKVNGKTSWISSSNTALWYIATSVDWIIGSVDDLGTYTGGITPTGNQGISSCPYDVANDDWEYWNNNVWIIPDANDINVECLSGNDRFASLSLFEGRNILLDILHKIVVIIRLLLLFEGEFLLRK